MLIAPTYPPASSFEPPASVAYVVSLENSSLAELMNNEAAWQIVLKHLPTLKLMTGSPMIKPHLGNFTVHSMQAFVKMATPDILSAIDEELARLPAIEQASP